MPEPFRSTLLYQLFYTLCFKFLLSFRFRTPGTYGGPKTGPVHPFFRGWERQNFNE